MSFASPSTYLVWSILSSLLGLFLVFHLYQFDRFKCLKWNTGPASGAFKRVMTYTYILSIPLIIAYSIGNAIIKYNVGFEHIEALDIIIPMRRQFWPEQYQNAVLPLLLCFTVAWSFEMVTHLEELMFWLFLVNAGSKQQDWLRSPYFKTWAVGAVLALIYMPVVVILTHEDIDKCEAYIFLAGSLGSLSLTLWFIPILWTFPSFIRGLEWEGVDPETVIRLVKFHEMNTLRVVFRFCFTIPLVILGIDGVRDVHHILNNMAAYDSLAMLAGFGCVVSSGLTLAIFFPRSISTEMAAKKARKGEEPQQGLNVPRPGSQMTQRSASSITKPNKHGITPFPMEEYPRNQGQHQFPAYRRGDEDVEAGFPLSEHNVEAHNSRMVNVDILVHHRRDAAPTRSNTWGRSV